MKRFMRLIWNGDVSAVTALFRQFKAHNLPPRKLFFYGFTVGQVGVGVLVSRKLPERRSLPGVDISKPLTLPSVKCERCPGVLLTRCDRCGNPLNPDVSPACIAFGDGMPRAHYCGRGAICETRAS
jgi:hypothetical protein